MFEYINNLANLGPDRSHRFTTLGSFLGTIINVALGIGMALSIITVVISGIKFMASQGDPKAKDAARKSLTYSIVALVLVLGALAVKIIILNILGAQGEVMNATPSF